MAKKMSKIRDIRFLLSIVGIMSVTCCQNDSMEPSEDSQQTTMELVPLSTPFLDVQRMGTRAEYENNLPKGYIPFDQLYPTTLPEHKTIGVFLTPNRTSSIGSFVYEGKEEGISKWKSTIRVEPDIQYYIYGFMPREDAESVEINPLNGNYAEGAILSVNNYKPITAADVCVLVGIRKATAEERITGPTSPVALGNFGYVGGSAGQNFIFVLLKHIYAGLHFKFHIDSDYHKLRSIKVKHVELLVKDISEYVNLTITLTANDVGDDPLTNVDYSLSSSTINTSVQLFDNPTGYDVPEVAPEGDPEGFLACFVPSSCYNFVLRTTYDVYDSKGNLIRESCVAENQINRDIIPELELLNAGDALTVDMFIKPTYLHVLSDPDLDNPTIKPTL